MSTWVVQVAVVALFALACGTLAAALIGGRLGIASIALALVALAAWGASFVVIASEFRDGNDFATCEPDCTATHYATAVAFVGGPLLLALAGLGMIVARSRRWRLGRTRENPS